MNMTACSILAGKITAVDHFPHSCRITIELSGTPRLTAGIMKESTVELGWVTGEQVCAEFDTSHLCVGRCQKGD